MCTCKQRNGETDSLEYIDDLVDFKLQPLPPEHIEILQQPVIVILDIQLYDGLAALELAALLLHDISYLWHYVIDMYLAGRGN